MDVFQGVFRDGLFLFWLLCIVQNLAFNGRMKYTGNKSLDLFTYPLPGKKNGVALTSLPGLTVAVLCTVVRWHISSEPLGVPGQC